MSELRLGLINDLARLELEKTDLLGQITEKDEAIKDLSEQKDAAIAAFDSQIGALRTSRYELLAHCREVESDIGSITVGAVIAEQAANQEEWNRLWHERLKVLWSRYQIEIPEYGELAPLLTRSREIIELLEADIPDLKGELGPLLIPPSDTDLSIPVKTKLPRTGNECITTVSEHWRLVVTMLGPEGLALSGKELIEQKKYMMSGLDTRQMGATEYIALMHQGPHFKFDHYQQGLIDWPALDRSSSTLLLKNYHVYKDHTWEGKGLIIATYDEGGYRINEGFIDFGRGYRPTVEV
jgi:hypothetical protein